MEKIKRVSVNNVSKQFMIGHSKNMGALARLVSFFSGREPKTMIFPLKNFSLDVYSGQIVGIMGDNGSGKSTLLRIIAGIYSPDGGEILINGKIISLINLTAGLKERLTMKENIFLCCSLFGLSQKDVKEKFDQIVSFSGLKEFVDTKIYQFSEGMKQRISFSIAVNCNPDILLLDEVFEVGDEDFKEKSAEKIQQIVKSGVCVILVSHNAELVNKYCTNVINLCKNG
jgi:ABC-type polysaccharide/polyol phosphate transport system ATPase subunit